LKRQAAVLLIFLGSGLLFLAAAIDFPWWVVSLTLGVLAIFIGVAVMASDDDDDWPQHGAR